MLILFDIDATLIKTSGAGIRAMVRAGRSLFGESFTADGIEFAGRLDPLIIADMLRRSGVEPSPHHAAAMRREYRAQLGPELERTAAPRTLPGVPGLLRALAARTELTLGLLTGNFAETGCIKLRACGIDPDAFGVQVWGDDSPHDPPRRDHLPAVAMERYRARTGQPVDPGRVTIIGDTPHDIRCALVNGCRALGVATGQFGVDRLVEAGAHRAVADLTATEALVVWLTR